MENLLGTLENVFLLLGTFGGTCLGTFQGTYQRLVSILENFLEL